MKFLRIFSLPLCIYLCFCTFSCKNPTVSKEQTANKVLKEFPFVKVPSLINDPKDANAFILEHYWDAFCGISTHINDSLTVNSVEKNAVSQAVVNYIYSAGSDSRIMEKAIAQLGASLDSTTFLAVTEILDFYLYDPNSPYRNEELYLPVAQYLANYPQSTKKEAYAKYAALCSLNRVGEVAADFRWCTKTGQTGTLHKIKAPYTIIFFSNPGCHDCKRVIDVFTNDQTLTSLVATKKITFLNYYTDENLGEWLKYMPIYPKEWINAYDPDFEVKDNKKYNIRAIPSIYLLDKDKKVIMKDADCQAVIAYIQNL